MQRNEAFGNDALNLEQISIIEEEKRVSRLQELKDGLAKLESDISEDLSPTSQKRGEELYLSILSCILSGKIDAARGRMLLQKNASDGDAYANLVLGDMYSDPSHELRDPQRAFLNYSTAARAGIGKAYYRLGLCHNTGFGTEKNAESACEAFVRGAELDDLDCICALGICREFGIGCEVDFEIAAAVYERAARAGSATAANNLGGCYLHGHGVRENKEKAFELFNTAAELGSSNAECRIGLCYEKGIGCDVDTTLAIIRFRRAAKMKNTEAIYHLGRCHYMGIGTEQNYAKAYRYYLRAAEDGHADAMYYAGRMSIKGKGTKKDPAAAHKLFSRATEKGHPYAEYELGNCYFEGLGGARNRNLAYKYYSHAYASDPALKEAAYMLGLCKLKGFGTEKNEEDAFGIFYAAAELGSPEAKYMLGECYYYGVGTENDSSLAAKAFADAINSADEDSPDAARAMLALGLCYEQGDGVEQSSEHALSLYKRATKHNDSNALYLTARATMTGSRNDFLVARGYMLRAARQGHSRAQLMMGKFADDGNGVVQNREDAKRWYAKVISSTKAVTPSPYEFPQRADNALKRAKDDSVEAQYRLGMLVARNNPSPQNYIASFEYIASAASLGHEGAQAEISKIYLCGGDLKAYYESDFSNEDALFQNGTDEPDKETLADAMNKLGDSLFSGKSILKKNESAGAKCYRIAAELGQNDACYSLGWCLRHGAGVQENSAEAIKWLKLSADRGNPNAAYSYGLCCEEGAGTGIKNKRDALTYYRQAAAVGHTDAALRYSQLAGNDE